MSARWRIVTQGEVPSFNVIARRVRFRIYTVSNLIFDKVMSEAPASA